MNKEKLDILLQNKLSHLESNVQDHERTAIFKQFGVAKKRRGLWPMLGLATLCFLAGIGFSMYFFKQSPMLAPTVQTVSNSLEHSSQDKVQIIAKPSLELPLENKPIQKTLESGKKLDRKDQNLFSYSTKLTHEKFPNLTRSTSNGLLATADEEAQLKMGAFKIKPAYYEPVNFEKAPYLSDLLEPKLKHEKGCLKSIQQLKPELSFYIAPQFAVEKESIKYRNSEYVNTNYLKYQNEFESSLLAVNAGFGLSFSVFSNLKIGTGLAYFSSANRYNYQYIINQIPIVDSASNKILGYIKVPDSSSAKVYAQGKKVSRYVEIPLSLRFKLYANSKFHLGFEPGFSLQFLTRSTGQYMDRVSLQLMTQNNMKSRNGNFQLAFPLSFNTSQQFSWRITPFVGRTTSNISNLPQDEKYRIYSGIKFSINYKIFKQTK